MEQRSEDAEGYDEGTYRRLPSIGKVGHMHSGTLPCLEGELLGRKDIVYKKQVRRQLVFAPYDD